jgi:hypothetical protein
MAWNLEDVESLIKELEKRPPGSVGDQDAKDINKFLKDLRHEGLWNAYYELCLRGQKAVVDYQKRQNSG